MEEFNVVKTSCQHQYGRQWIEETLNVMIMVVGATLAGRRAAAEENRPQKEKEKNIQ